ncbi:MAG: ABC transporter ATP-binding protein [bacterium]|nr:ABC transporter ATP-binding protein [bacterium]
MIKIKNLTKKFDAQNAVTDLSLEIGAGEIFACIGPNGSGKTTTVKMLAGLYMPTAGNIEIGGISLANEPEKAKALLGYIPDVPFIYEKMSGREFLGFVAALYRMPSQEMVRSTHEWISIFPGLSEVIDGYVENYSRGNKQKLAIIAALLHRPKILLIDEPMVGLDPQSVLTVKKLLKDFSQKGQHSPVENVAGGLLASENGIRPGGAVFLCTHTLPVAEELATRIGILEKGKLIAIGTLEELRTKTGKPSADLEEVYLALTS